MLHRRTLSLWSQPMQDGFEFSVQTFQSEATVDVSSRPEWHGNPVFLLFGKIIEKVLNMLYLYQISYKLFDNLANLIIHFLAICLCSTSGQF